MKSTKYIVFILTIMLLITGISTGQMASTNAHLQISDDNSNLYLPEVGLKSNVAIDFIKGDVSKINQNEFRAFIKEKLISKGFDAAVANSSDEIKKGKFDYILSVEIKSLRSKDSSKSAVTQIDMNLTLYTTDKKRIVARESKYLTHAGTTDDGVKVAF